MGSSNLQVEIGSRIYCDGEYGTVLYIGPIEGLDGNEWILNSRFFSIFFI